MATAARAPNGAVALSRCPAAWPETSYRLSKSAFCTVSELARITGTGHQRRSVETSLFAGSRMLGA